MDKMENHLGYHGRTLKHDESAAEAIISVLLDDKETPKEIKHWIKHTLVPMLELVDDASSPKDTVEYLLRLNRFLAIAVSYGISKCSKPSKWAEMTSILEKDYSSQLKIVMGLTEDMRKKAEIEQGMRWK